MGQEYQMGEKNERKPGIHSIQMKIMAVSLWIAVGTAVVSLIISFYAEIDTIKSTTEKYVEQYISFADQEFNDMLVESKKVILSIAMAQEFISPNLVEKKTEASYSSFQHKKQIKSFLAGFLSQKDYIEDIMLVMEDGMIYQAGSGMILKKELETPIMKQALSSTTLETLFDENDELLILCRPVTYLHGEVKGTVVLKLNYDYITSVYDIEFLRAVVLCLYLPDGQLFYLKEALEGEEISENAIFENERIGRDIMTKESSTGYVTWRKKSHYYLRYISDTSNMILIGLIPQDILLKDAQDLKRKFLIIGGTASAAALLAAWYLSKKICANLKRLSTGMEAVRAGDLGVRMEIAVPDEIGALADTFNVMMDQIETLMAEVLLKEKRKREAEQEVLASQIEPHFLYNSIDSIRYVAHMRGESEIEQVADALSQLLRSVLSNHNEFITLWEEKDYIENYMTIERFKYRKSFAIVWDVDEDLWAYPVPKLLLQPVVENALIHGIAARTEGEGAINVKIYSQQNIVILKVMDNGKGMSEEKLEELRSNIERKDRTGFRRIGVSNVFNRIRLIYGKEFGGTIDSCEDVFTCVELHLPLGGTEDGFNDFTG